LFFVFFFLLPGACLEDKLFPKTNSLLDGRAQPLADIDEFALKIKVCTSEDKEFVLLDFD
jgi:phosphoenolpyruvate phosphomutase